MGDMPDEAHSVGDFEVESLALEACSQRAVAQDDKFEFARQLRYRLKHDSESAPGIKDPLIDCDDVLRTPPELLPKVSPFTVVKRFGRTVHHHMDRSCVSIEFSEVFGQRKVNRNERVDAGEEASLGVSTGALHEEEGRTCAPSFCRGAEKKLIQSFDIYLMRVIDQPRFRTSLQPPTRREGRQVVAIDGIE
jgi:hypothetical protein